MGWWLSVARVVVDGQGSDGWWLERLGKMLFAEQERLNRLDSYLQGDPPLPGSAPTARHAYRLFQRLSRLNLAETITEAPRKRMIPTGFRTGADGDENGDRAARALWDGSDLDVGSIDVHQGMLGLGRSYVIVGKDDTTGEVVATPEDARQVITIHDPLRPNVARAAVKIFRNEYESLDWAYLYLPGRVVVASKPIQTPGTGIFVGGFQAGSWDWDEDRSFVLDEPLSQIVPVVRFLNARRGQGEFEGHTDTLDRINTMILQRVVVAVMQAFRQRAVKGDLPTHDDRGVVINYDEVFAAGPDALWQLPGEVDIWESATLDLGPLLMAVKDDIMQLASATDTPMHQFTPDAATGSAEGASLQREDVVFKAKDRIKRASAGWRRVMSLMFRFDGDLERADLRALEPMWAPPEQWSLSERADAGSKMTDVPWRTKMTEVYGFDPEIVDRMESERAADAFLAQALAVQAAPVPSRATQQPGGASVAGAPGGR